MTKKYPNIINRIFIGFAILLLIQLTVSVVYRSNLKELDQIVNNILNHPFTVSNSVRDINVYINAIHRTMKDVTLAEDSLKLEEEIRKVDSFEIIIHQRFEIVKERFLGNKEEVEQLHQLFFNWKPIRDEVIALVKQEEIDKAVQITRGKGAKHVDLLISETKKLIDFANNKANEFNKASLDSLNRSFVLLTVSILVSILVALIAVYFVYTSISRPLNDVIEKIRMISKTSFDQKIPKKETNKIRILDHTVEELFSISKALHKEIEERKAAEKELNEYKDQLEQLVEDRTKKLNNELEERLKIEKELNEYKDNLEKKVDERTAEIKKKNEELEYLNNLFVGREFRIKELREEIAKLKESKS